MIFLAPPPYFLRRTHLGGVEIPKDSCLNENNTSGNVEIYHENPTLPAKLKTLTKLETRKMVLVTLKRRKRFLRASLERALFERLSYLNTFGCIIIKRRTTNVHR